MALVGSVDFDVLVGISYVGIFTVFPLLLFYGWQRGLLDFSWKWNHWLANKKEGVLAVLPQLIIVVVYQADRYLVQYFGNQVELSSYFTAQALYMVILFGVQAVFSVCSPRVSNVALVGEGDIRSEGRILIYVFLGLSVCLVPLSYTFIDLLGVDKAITIGALLIFVGGGILASLFGAGFLCLQYCKNKNYYLLIVLFGCVLQYAIVLSLYSVLGVFAAAIGLATYTLATSLLGCLFWQRRGVKVLPFYKIYRASWLS